MDDDQAAFLEYLSSLTEMNPAKARIERNRARAKELHEAKDSGVRSMGRFMAAPHPLEVLATLAQRQQGMQQRQQADQDEDALLKQRNEVLKELRRRIEQGQQQTQAPQQPSFGGGGLIEDPWGVAGTSF